MPTQDHHRKKNSKSCTKSKRKHSKKCKCQKVQVCCPGPAGVGIAGALLNGCNLVLTLTNGQVLSFGPLCGPTGPTGPTSPTGFLPDIDFVNGLGASGCSNLTFSTFNPATGASGTSSVDLLAGCSFVSDVTAGPTCNTLTIVYSSGNTATVDFGCNATCPIMMAINGGSNDNPIAPGGTTSPFIGNTADFDVTNGLTGGFNNITGCYVVPVSGVYRVVTDLTVAATPPTSSFEAILFLQGPSGIIKKETFAYAGATATVLITELSIDLLRCFAAGDTICPGITIASDTTTDISTKSLDFNVQRVCDCPT